MDLENATKIKRILRKRCCIGSGFTLFGLDKAKQELKELILRSINHNESNSVLLVGPKGSGKTQLVETVLNEVEGRFTKIYLNGLLQVDEGVALKEIIRQLRIEQDGLKSFASTHENLQYVMDLIRQDHCHSKDSCLLIVMDEFDLFLKQKNQGLLYNLFDVLQSHNTATCLVGLTTRLDVMELFEKRVKSRFSQRIIHTFLEDNSLQAYIHKARHFLSLPLATGDLHPDCVLQWNHHIKSLMEEPVIVDILRKQHAIDNDLRLLMSFLIYPIASLSLVPPYHLDSGDFVKSFQLLHASDSRVSLLQGMSVLELSLMVCMHRLDEVYNGEAVNFEMLYLEYMSFIGKKFSNMAVEKTTVFKAFENICHLELIKPVSDSGGGCSKEYRMVESMVGLTQLKQAIKHFHNCPTNIRQWIDEAT